MIREQTRRIVYSSTMNLRKTSSDSVFRYAVDDPLVSSRDKINQAVFHRCRILLNTADEIISLRASSLICLDYRLILCFVVSSDENRSGRCEKSSWICGLYDVQTVSMILATG